MANFRNSMLLTMVATGVFAVPAGASAAQAQTQPSYDDADVNHDGRVTLQEFKSYMIDRLTADAGPRAEKFRYLTPQQQAARLRRRFDMADREHKGYLDRADWDAAEARIEESPVTARATRREGLSLGLGIADVDPGYAGYHHRIDPLPLISYRSDRFVLAGTSASVIVSQANAYTLSLGLVPQLDRVSANDSLQLAGIQTREWTIDGAVTLSTRQPWGRASFAVLHDILDRNNGTEVRLNYSYPIPLGTGTLAPGVGLTWESENLADYYYGVSTAESLPDRPAYSPGSALNPNVRLDYTVALSRKWLFGAEANYVNFARSIRNSPIIDHKGSSAIMVFFVRSFSPGATTSAHTLVMPIEH